VIFLCNPAVSFYSLNMGFRLEVDGAQKAKLVAGAAGDSLTTFIDAIRDALNQRITSFSVEVSSEPKALEAVLEPLRKLQQLVKSRGQTVTLTGSGLEGQSKLAQELHALGIKMPDVDGLVKKPQPDAPLSSSEAELVSDELKIIFKELDTDFGGELELPPAERVTPYMSAVQNRLASLLKLEDALKVEEDTLHKRLTYLKKREPGGTKNLAEYNLLLEEEKEIDKLRDQIPKLRKELIVAKESASNQEKVYKDYAARIDIENRKKQDSLKKELQSLKDNFKKIEAEIAKQKSTPSKKEGP
jgi:hypothetical protein